MTEYIINPMFFYWMQVANELSFVLIIFGIILFFVTVALCVAGYINDAFEDDEEKEKYKKPIKTMAIITAICLVVNVFIPSKETLIEMSIAKIATVENTQNAVEAIKEATDYVFEKIEGLK